MEFSTFTTDALTAMRDAAMDNEAMAPLVPMMNAELDARAAAEIKAAEAEAIRELCDSAASLLSDIGASKVAEVASQDNAAYKGAARSLVALIMAAYDVSIIKAQHAFDVLTDTTGATDVKDVAGAVEYSLAHVKSTVYR
jgi:hypothetical protein